MSPLSHSKSSPKKYSLSLISSKQVCVCDERLPKKMLFGELKKRRLCHSIKRRWRDVAAVDLQALGAKEEWYKLCQDRKKWFECCRAGVNEVASCRKKNACAANREC